MKSIVDLILRHYSYTVEDEIKLPSIRFYKHKDKKIASYFLINSIDCRTFENNEEAMKLALDALEIDYSSANNDNAESIRLKIQQSFDNNQEASQIDKNTSAIYLLKFNDMVTLTPYRNLVYAIEESPNYFKRYIIPYTESQVTLLQKIIDDFEGRSIDDVLSDIANNEDEYYKLLESKNVGGIYELVIRLFSKLPFLQYKFKADTMPISIEMDISQKVEGNLCKYHNAIQSNNCMLDQLLNLEPDIEIDDQTLEKELNRMLGGDLQ